MSDLTFVQGDTGPSVRSVLTDVENNRVLDLTDAGVVSVKFQMRKPDDRNQTVDAAAVIVDAEGGIVRYDWAANDLATAGDYLAQWELTYSDGTVQTTDPPNTITVRR